MDTRELIAMGERLGLSGEELRQWVQAEQKHLRDERALDREEKAREQKAMSERAEHERVKAEQERVKAEQERVKAEQERARAEVEERNLQLRIRLAELHSARGGGPQTDGDGETTGQAQAATPQGFSARKSLPPFEDARDDLDAYLKRFECVAQSQGWPKSKWAIAISTCLTGEALKVYGRLSPEESLDYDQVKLALLQRFRFTAEGYRERFRHSKPEKDETAKQYAARLKGYFDRWVELSSIDKTFDNLADLLITEQLLSNCHRKLAMFVRERNCKTLSETATAADHFMDAQKQNHLLIFEDNNGEQRGNPETSERNAEQQDSPGPNGVRKEKWRMTNAVLDIRARMDNMPVSKGRVEDKPAIVLRDTGTNTVIVRQSLIPRAAFTGTTCTLQLADGKCVTVPEAKVFIESPFFTGMVLVSCLKSPLYDVIIGNVRGARDFEDLARSPNRLSPETGWPRNCSRPRHRKINAARGQENAGYDHDPGGCQSSQWFPVYPSRVFYSKRRRPSNSL
ncbi:hypothetical protein HPB48_021679 [Haemaphysalis longicornis]|uniref:SCAN box domain-containing protein n=1 Tax=Haemaphysalis longicornis TaxID=44386 RepID=A0A9J6FXQ1_HAELO|nr:hypothetical protein HPB48_021679 [Haemaphysalis longicornis]